MPGEGGLQLLPRQTVTQRPEGGRTAGWGCRFKRQADVPYAWEKENSRRPASMAPVCARLSGGKLTPIKEDLRYAHSPQY